MSGVSAIRILSSISFPNTGGMAVSSHALTAIFHVRSGRDLGGGLGDQI